MSAAVLAAHRNDAAVAAAEAASHDALDRYLARPPVPCGNPRRRRQHRFGTAGVEHHGRLSIARGELPIERRDDTSRLARAAVLGRQDELDAERTKEIEMEEFRRAARAVKERRQIGR